ncbi:MAG: sialidase family protein [Gemmataceae bacterium]
MFARFCFLLAGLLVSAWSVVAGPPEKKRKDIPQRVVQLKSELLRPCEVSVAINPKNPKHFVASALGYPKKPGGSKNASFVSFDAGKTWKAVLMPNPDNRTQGDDAVAFGPDGTVFHTYISFTGLRRKRAPRVSSGIFCNSSKDGLKWKKPVPVVDHINTDEPFEDKPWIVCDCSEDSPHKGNIYVAWTKFDVYGSRDPKDKSHIYFSRSTNGGKSFTPSWKISDFPGDALDDDDTVEGAVPAVGPKGEVYVAWAGPKGLVIDKSTDGGVTFGKDTFISKMPGGWNIPVKGIPRHNGLPITKVDCSKGKFRGSVYVNWIDERNGDPDVFVSHSRDGAKTWSKPIRVNDDKVKNGVAQMFAWMAVDPVDGSVNVIFHDRRGLKGTNTGVTLARSVDGGKTFVNYRVKQKPSEFRPVLFFGDYNGIAARGGRVVAVYPHFTGKKSIEVSAAVFRFQPGTQKPHIE